MDIAGRLALVTGAASGLGAATARRLLADGGVVALIDRDAAAVHERARELGTGALACALDVTDAGAAEAMFAEVEAAHGAPAVLVNCAGIAPAGKIVGRNGPLDLMIFRHVVEVNLVGTFNMLRLAAAAMMRGEPDADGARGVIVNTSSVAAVEGQIGQAAYAASKGGIAALTLPAARELAGSGIRVVAIAPGLFATPLLLNMPEAVQASLAATVPYPTRFGSADEFAALVAHIIANPMLNGELIRLDGALRMAPR